MGILKWKFGAGKIRKNFVGLAVIIVVLVGVVAWQGIIIYKNRGRVDFDLGRQSCNVARINIYGELVTYGAGRLDANRNVEDKTSADDVVAAIKKAKGDKSVKAIMLAVDSGGGSGVAAEEIVVALKDAGKPTAAVIRDAGDSAAYWAVSGCDRIFASDNSDVGSIGITMSYLDNVNKNQSDGLTYNQLSVGKFKDSGDPDKPLTEAERQLFMRDVNIEYNNFIKDVATNRNMSIEAVKNLADGSTMLGKMALDSGLIDQIGGIFEAQKYISQKIGKGAVVCN
jgi:protease-4